MLHIQEHRKSLYPMIDLTAASMTLSVRFIFVSRNQLFLRIFVHFMQNFIFIIYTWYALILFYVCILLILFSLLVFFFPVD